MLGTLWEQTCSKEEQLFSAFKSMVNGECRSSEHRSPLRRVCEWWDVSLSQPRAAKNVSRQPLAATRCVNVQLGMENTCENEQTEAFVPRRQLRCKNFGAKARQHVMNGEPIGGASLPTVLKVAKLLGPCVE